MTEQIIRVAVNLLLIKDHKILLGKRLGPAGTGAYGVPGGHIEYGEKLEDGARRELREETGVEAEKLDFLQIINTIGDRHYVHVNFLVTEWRGDITNTEPEKCQGWEWFNLDNLPEPIFLPHQSFIAAYKQNKLFFE